jgi:tripartite-type tricarboxylate transporter receptor subunit TctC
MGVQRLLKTMLFTSSFVLLAAMSHMAVADDPVKGPPISLVIGGSVGGSYDTAGRTIARYIGQYIPGKPNIVTRNMPGAAGLAMVNYLYNAAPADGKVIGVSNNTIPLLPLLGELPANVKFDVTKLQWIGTPSQEVFVTFIRNDAPFRTVEDLRSRESLIGAARGAGNSIILPRLMNLMAGTKMHVVTGYSAQNEIFFAIDKGEIQGTTTGLTNLTVGKPDWLRENKVRILIQYSAVPMHGLKDVPLAVDLIASPADKEVVKFLTSVHRIARPLVAPPGVPAEQMRILRAAFNSTMKDTAFLADSEKLGLDIDPVGGEEIAAIIASIYATPKDVIEHTRTLLDSIDVQ